MSEKIEEYQHALRDCIMAARMVGLHDLPRLLGDIEHADTIGPILNPTLWIMKHEKMQEDREVFEAALHLWRLGMKLKAGR